MARWPFTDASLSCYGRHIYTAAASLNYCWVASEITLPQNFKSLRPLPTHEKLLSGLAMAPSRSLPRLLCLAKGPSWHRAPRALQVTCCVRGLAPCTVCTTNAGMARTPKNRPRRPAPVRGAASLSSPARSDGCRRGGLSRPLSSRRWNYSRVRAWSHD